MLFTKNIDSILPNIDDNIVAYSACGVEPASQIGQMLPISQKSSHFNNLDGRDIEGFLSDNADILRYPKYFLCVWKSGGKFKMDVCIQIYTKIELINRGILMGLEEVLIKNDAITLPTPQSVGTNTQKAMYATCEANKILLNL